MTLLPEHKIIPDKKDVVCAEIPHPTVDHELHEIVMSYTVHRPCGSINPESSCMEDEFCTKNYPKVFVSVIQLGTGWWIGGHYYHKGKR